MNIENKKAISILLALTVTEEAELPSPLVFLLPDVDGGEVGPVLGPVLAVLGVMVDVLESDDVLGGIVSACVGASVDLVVGFVVGAVMGSLVSSDSECQTKLEVNFGFN